MQIYIKEWKLAPEFIISKCRCELTKNIFCVKL